MSIDKEIRITVMSFYQIVLVLVFWLRIKALLRHAEGNILVEYDEEYGIEHRRGWSIAVDNGYVVEFSELLGDAIKVATEKTKDMER